MAVLIKGNSIQCSQKSRDHYLRGKENERITVREVTGFATKDAEEALRIMALAVKGSKCQKPVYSAKINPEGDRLWTKDEIRRAVDLLEENLGLQNHPRVVVEHKKHGRIHFHVLWSRFPPEGGAAVRMSNNYAIHKKTQSQIEQEFELRPMRTKGRDFKHSEVEWAKRYGFDIFKLREQITAAFNSAKCGQAFNASLKEQGIVLCRGDKSQFVLILPWGQHKALSSMIHGRPTKAVLRRALGDIEITKLPTVTEGKATVKARMPKAKPMTKAKSVSTIVTGKGNHTHANVKILGQITLRSMASERIKMPLASILSATLSEPTKEASSHLPQQARLPFAQNYKRQDALPITNEAFNSDETLSGRAATAYQEEFDKWVGLIESATTAPSVSKDQRLANVRALRLRQQAAAQVASKQVIEEETATMRAQQMAKKNLIAAIKSGLKID